MFGRKGIIGLDIGSSYIKAVQLKETRSGYELELCDMLPISPELIVEGSIIDSIRLTEELRELIKKAKIKAKDAVISMSGHSAVIIKRISLPEMTEEELSESIKFEAEQYIPFDIEDVNIDFQILGPCEEPGQMDVILVAVKKEVVNDYVNVVTEAGLHPVIVDVDAFALENMYEINYGIEADTQVALVNIGATSINMNIVKGGVSTFTRGSSVGSYLHTEALQKEFNVSFEDAERLKKGESLEKITPEDAQPVIIETSEEIVAEIKRSIDFFKRGSSSVELKEIILSGGCALIKGFPELVSERLGIEVRRADPFRNIKIPKKFEIMGLDEIGPLFAVAVGLAVRRPGDR